MAQPSTHGRFYWNELMTKDVEVAKAFFATSIGWSFDAMPMPEGTYWIAKQGDAAVGGLMTMPADMPAGTPSHWIGYLAVDDIDARIARMARAGGNLCRPVFEVPGVGRIAIIADPTGAVMGWIQPAG